MSGAYERIERERVVAILRPDDPAAATAQLEALAEAGIACAEISLATQAGRAALAPSAEALGDRLLLGAGTVRSVADAEQAVDAGARFLVSPGLDEDVVAWAKQAGVAHLPGVLTPTELGRALAAGATLVKLFPAGRLGPGYVRDLLGPFPHARLVPTGGVDAANAADFIAAGAVAVAVGGALAPAADPNVVSERAARLLRAVRPRTPQEA